MSNKKLTFDWLPGAGEVDENNLQTPADTVKDLTLSEYGEIAQFVPGQATDFLADRELAKRASKAVNMEGERNAGDRSNFHFGSDDVNDLVAQDQSTAQKWGYGVTKLVGKTGVNVMGSFGMLGSGLATTADWIVGGHEGEESWRDIWDNDYQRGLDSINKWMDNQLPHYYTKAEQERAWYKNIMGDGAANFWANDVSNGLSFIIGAVLSEVALSAATAYTLGAAAPAQAAVTAGIVAKGTQLLNTLGKSKAAQTLKHLTRGKALTNSARGSKVAEVFHKSAPNIGKRLKAGGLLSRRLLTGAGYESGVEARHHIDALHAHLAAAEEARLGRPLRDEEVADLYDLANASGNSVFAGNLALVGVGNFIAFPKLFGAGFHSSHKKFGKILKEGAGYRAAWDSYSKTRKGLNYAYAATKRGAYEGVVEEGGQSWLDMAGQHSGVDYYMRGKRPSQLEAVNGLMSGMYDTFERNYSSNQTQKEMGIGFILGAIGLPTYTRQETTEKDKDGKPVKGKRKFQMMGGMFESLRNLNTSNHRAAEMAKFANENPSAFEALKQNYDSLIKDGAINEEQDVALATNNMFAWKNLKDDRFFNYVASRAKIGYYEDVVDNIEQIREMDNQQFAEAFGYEGLTDTELSDRKEKVVESALRKAEKIRKAVKTVEREYKGENEGVREAMEHALSSVEFVGEREESIYNLLDDITNGSLNARTDGTYSEMLKAMMGTGTTTIGGAISNLKETVREDAKLPDGSPQKLSPEALDAIAEQITSLEKGVAELSIDNAVSDMAAMNFWKAVDPDGYASSPRREEARQLLADLRKLRERRQQAIQMYNNLNTVAGERDFNKYVQFYEDKYAEQTAAREEATTEEAVSTGDPEAIYNANAEAQFIVEHPETQEEVLMKFAGKDKIQGVEDPSIKYSSDMLKTNLVRVVSPSTVEVSTEPLKGNEISVESSTVAESNEFETNEVILRKPDFSTVGFNKTSGFLDLKNLDSISPSQKAFFKYLHGKDNYNDVEIELVAPTTQEQKHPKAPAEKPTFEDRRVPVKTEEFNLYEEDGKLDVKLRAVTYLDGHVEWKMDNHNGGWTPYTAMGNFQGTASEILEQTLTLSDFKGSTYTTGKVGGPDSIMNPKMKAKLTEDQLNRVYPKQTKTVKNEKYPWLTFQDKDDIKTVVVDKKTGEPVQSNGEYIYTSLMLPTMKSTKGNERFSGLEYVSPQQIKDSIEQFKALREQAKQGNVRLPITGRSMLLPNFTEFGGRFGVIGRTIENREDLADIDLKIAITNELPVNGEIYNVNPGELYQIYNNVAVPLYHRTLTPAEVDTVTNLLVMYAQNVLSEDPNIQANPDQIVGSEIGRESNLKIIDAIRSMIRFGGYKASSPTYNKDYQIKKTNKGIQYRGNEIATFKNLAAEDPTTLQNLKIFLSNKIHDVNNNLLKNNDVFNAVTLTNEGLDVEPYTNYKEYLVSPRSNPSDIPYTTNIVPPSSSTVPNSFQFKGGYLMFEAPTQEDAPVKAKPTTSTITGKEIDERIVTPLSEHFTIGTNWSLRGMKDGKPREARFEVVSKNNVTQLAVSPNQDKVMTSLIQGVMQPNITNPDFTLGTFHAIVMEEFDKTVDSYAEVKPKLLKLDATEVNPFDQVEGQTSKPVTNPQLDLFSLNPLDKIKGRRNKGNTKKLDAQRKLIGDYKKINIEQEKAWFESKFDIPFNTMKALVSGSNYGEFRQLADVMISEMAIEGTTYHEAFHVVHDYFLTPEQKEQLYSDYKKYAKVSDMTNEQIEEEIAEEFRHYMLKDGLSKVPQVKGLKAFFKRVWDFIKSLGTDKRFTAEGIRLSNLFESIRNSDYRTPSAQKTALLNRFLLSVNPTVKTLGDANVTETKAMLEGYVNSVFDELYKEESDLHLLDLFEISKNIELPKKFEVLMQEGFANMMGGLRNQIEEQTADKSWVRRDDWTREKQDSVYSMARFFNQTKPELFQLFGEWLDAFSVNVELEQDTNLNRKENNFGSSAQVIQTSAKNNAPNSIKLLIASLPINDSISPLVGLPGIVNYRNIFDSLHNELAGTQSFEGQVAAIKTMALNRPDIAAPLETLLSRLKVGVAPSNLSTKDRMLQTKFTQQFDKTKNTYYLNLVKDGVKINSTDSNVTKTETLITNEWESKFRQKALSKEGFLRLNPETGAIGIDPKKSFKLGKKTTTYKNLPTLKGENFFRFLNLIGINFTNENAIKNNPTAFAELVEQTTYIKSFFLDKQGNDINVEVEALFKTEESGVVSRLNKLVALELPYYTNTIELQHITPDNKKAYGITLGNFLTRVSNSLSRGVIPQYIEDSMEVMQGSEWLKHVEKGGGIKIVVLEGARPDESGAVGKVTKDLTTTDKDAMYIHNTLNGRYPLLQASEKKTVFGFELYNNKGNVGAGSLSKGAAINSLVNHLQDEMQVTLNLMRDNTGNDINGFRDNAKQLRTFDYLNELPISSPNHNTLVELLQDPDSRLTAAEIIQQNLKEIQTAIDVNLADGIASTTAKLQSNGMLSIADSGVIHLYGVDAETFNKTLGITTNLENGYRNVAGDKLKISPTELNKFLETFVLKDKLAALEQLKLYFGDIGFFDVNSLYKRTAGPHGVKKFAVVDNNINEWLRQNIKRYDNKTPDGKVRTMVLRDPVVRSQYADEYSKVLGPLADGYKSYEEADAQGYITIDEYVEFLARTGDITLKHLELHQKVQKGEPLSSEEMIYFTPLKPQYYGPTEYKGLFAPAYYKTSLAVLLPQMLQRVNPKSGIAEPTTLSKLHDDMVKHQVGIVVFNSGVKIGNKVNPSTGLAQEFYGRGGRYVADNFDAQNIQTLYYDYLGIQVDMGTKVKDRAARGTQRVPLVLANLYDQGKAVSPEAAKLGEQYQSAHKALTSQDFANFVYKLGFDSNFNQIEDMERIKDALTQETKDRKLSDNELEGLELWLKSDDKFLELLSNKPALDSVLHSLFKRDVINKKYFGAAYAQLSSTGMEFDSDGRVIAKAMKQKDHMFGSDTSPLEFYHLSEDNSEVLGMEVMLPHYFKEFLGENIEVYNGKVIDSEGNTIAGKELLEVFGFRIPTTAINSVEAIRIKGFLPKEAGEAVMTPSEIVVKSGSDYDIDKLTINFPNYYVTRNGNVKQLVKIPYLDASIDALTKVQALRRYDKNTYKRMLATAGIQGSEKAMREYYNALELVLNTYKKDLFDVYNTEDIAQIDGQIDLLKAEIKNATVSRKKVLTSKIEDLIMDKMSMISGYTDRIFKLEESFNKLDSQLAESDYFKSLNNELQNAVPALQNREIDLARTIITRPWNYSQLINPVAATKLKSIARNIAEITGVPLTEDISYSNSLDFAHKQKMGQRFWEGMEALGIAAVENTSHVKTQPYDVYQDVNKFESINFQEIPDVPSPNSKGYSHIITHSKDIMNNNYVNEIIGEFVSAFVDVAKEPFVYGLNANMETISTMLSMVRKGATMETLGSFFMQPILQELVAELPKTKSFTLPFEWKRHNIEAIVKRPYYNKAGKLQYKGTIDRKQLETWLNVGRDVTAVSLEDQQNFAAGQLAVLALYNLYREQASEISSFTSMASYDTNAPMSRMHAKLKSLKKSNFLIKESIGGGIIGAEEFLNDTFMSGMVEATDSILPLFKEFYLTDDNIIVNRIIDNMANLLDYNSEQDVLKAISVAENDFVTYLISNTFFDSVSLSSLMQGPQSLPARWLKFQEQNPNNVLSKELFASVQLHTDPTQIGYKYDKLRMFARQIPALEANLLSEAFMELYNGSTQSRELAEDLVKFAIVQSGMNKSPVSFMKIVPPVLYSKYANEAITKYKMDAIDQSRFYDQFYRNNWNNDLIVPLVKLKYAGPSDELTPYPSMINNQVAVKAGSGFASRPYIKTYGPDPSISEDKKAKLEKAGKKPPVMVKLYKRDPSDPEAKIVRFTQVEKLGDGINLKEYYDHPNPKSIINVNNYIIKPNLNIVPSNLAKNKEFKAVEYQVLEGDIFEFEGIPVIPINTEGVHTTGIALQAKRKNLIQERVSDTFKATTRFITMPIKSNPDAPINLSLIEKGLVNISNIAQRYPEKKILVPLLEGDVDVIVPVLKALIDGNSNISIVLPDVKSSTTDRGSEHMEVIKKLLNC